MAEQLTESMRQKVLDRDDHQCVFCEKTEQEHKDECGRSLDIHHIVPRRAGGADEVGNLIAVCRSCHKTVENTLADGLERVKAQDVGESDRVQNLEQQLESLREEQRRQEQTDNREDIINALGDIFESCVVEIPVYIVHESTATTSRILYAGTSLGRAKDEFNGASDRRTLEQRKVTLSDWFDTLNHAPLDRASEKSDVARDLIYEHRDMDSHYE